MGQLSARYDLYQLIQSEEDKKLRVRDVWEGRWESILRRSMIGISILQELENTHSSLSKEREASLSWSTEHNGNFSTSLAWESLRLREDKVRWWKLVWPSKEVPRQSFILWLAFLDRLNLKDLIRHFIKISDPLCPLCGLKEESHDHLFFECPYSYFIWRNILSLLNVRRGPKRWTIVKEWAMDKSMGKSLQAYILKVALTSAVYEIWNERNARTYERTRRNKEHMLEDVKITCKIKIDAWGKFRNSLPNWYLYIYWGFEPKKLFGRH